MKSSKVDQVLKLAKRAGVIRARDLEPHNIPRAYLARLCEAGRLQRLGRGLYMLADSAITTNHSLVEAAKRVPHGVICLLSALRFHGVTTQAPFEVWIAIGNKARAPTANETPLRVVRFSGQALESGIETHLIDGVPTRIYSLAKTIADCFKYRNKIGLDVVLEALKARRRQGGWNPQRILDYARINRVAKQLTPYLEAIL